jgi:hypothetical protein
MAKIPPARQAKISQEKSICKYNSRHAYAGAGTPQVAVIRHCRVTFASRSQYNNFLPYGAGRMRSANGEMNEHERQQ